MPRSGVSMLASAANCIGHRCLELEIFRLPPQFKEANLYLPCFPSSSKVSSPVFPKTSPAKAAVGDAARPSAEMTDTKTEFQHKQLSKWAASIEQMRRKSDCTDVVLCCESHEFPAHRLLLCVNSPYFKAMFYSGMEESTTGKVILKGITPSTLELILHFIYTGDVGDIHKDMDSVKAALAAAHMYQIEVLYEYCWEVHKQRLFDTNFADIWNLAELYTHKEMMEYIPSTLAKRFCEVGKSPYFLQLSTDQMRRLISNKDNTASSYQVLQGILAWARENSDTCDKDELMELLSNVRQTENLLAPAGFTSPCFSFVSGKVS